MYIPITAGFLGPAGELRLPPSNGHVDVSLVVQLCVAYSPNWIRRFLSRSFLEGGGTVILHFP